MAIALDTAANSGFQLNVGTYTFNHTPGGANRLLVVCIGAGFAAGAIGAGSITFGVSTGTSSLTKAAGTAGFFTTSAEIWYLANPAALTGTIRVAMSGSCDVNYGQSISLTGVDTANPLDAAGSLSVSPTTSFNGTITTVADNAWLIDTMFDTPDGVPVDPTPGASQTIVAGTSELSFGFDAGVSRRGPITPAASTVNSWNWGTFSGHHVSYVMASFKPLAAAAATTNQSFMTLLGVGNI